MNSRNHKRVLAGLVLGMTLSACSFNVKIPFIPEPEPKPECSAECDAATPDTDSADEDATGIGSTVLKFLRGRQ